MSEKVKMVYRFIVDYIKRNKGRSPSYDEIMDACFISSKSAVYPILETLQQTGLIVLNSGARGIQLPNSKLVVEEV